MKCGALLLPVALTLASGCTPETRWGHEAVYAPDLRAYVIARADPPTLAPPLPVGDIDATRRIVLLNPITGEKIRCRDELGPALGAVTREAATALADDNTAFELTLPVVMTMPTTWAGAVLLTDVAGPLSSLPEAVRHLLSAPGADSLYAEGKRALEAKRFVEAERLFERALARSRRAFRGKLDDGPERASYYLGAIYELEGRRPEAARAYLRFIERADIRDVRAYDDAERRLAAIDPTALRPCRSQGPASFAWSRRR